MLEYYNYLIRLVEAGSLSKAASELYISPQGLSKALQQMSVELGVKLFYRDKSGLHLTSAGTEVYKAAKHVIEIDDILKSKLRAYASDEYYPETLIYSAPHINISFLQKSLRQFYRKNEKAKIKLIEMPPEEICKIENCSSNVLRFLSVVEPMFKGFLRLIGNDYSFYELDRATIMCCVSSKSALSKQEIVNKNVLEAHSLALFSTETDVVDLLFGEKFESKIGITVTNYNMLREIVAKDKSLVGLTDTLIERHLKSPDVTAIPFEPRMDTIYGYILRNDTQQSAAITELLEIINSQI